MKVIIFSHIADCDGITPVILSKLAFEQVDYFLAENNNNLSTVFLEKLDTLNQYDKIFVTDLCLTEEIVLNLTDEIKNKLKIFDHHKTALDMNKYPFINVIVEEDGIKQSATSLYYNYLLENYNNELLTKESTKTLVELVRLLDTWQWTVNNVIIARWLGEYLNIFGREEYIQHFYNYILNNAEFDFSEEEKFLFEVEDKKNYNYILEKEKEIIPIQVDDYKIGVVFAESNRSLLGDVLSKKYEKIYDFISIINISRGISYRSVVNKDVSTFAVLYGGGGHKNAAGSPIPDGLRELIIKEIFKDAIIGDTQ